MPEPLPSNVVAAMNASNKVEAIRLLRAHTGLGLAEAKDAVESGYVKPQEARTLPTQLPAEALAALQRGHKIDAIRMVREKYGLDLKTAKDVVETLAGGRWEEVSSAPTSLAPGEVAAGPNRTAVILLVVLVAALGAWWIFKPA